MAIDHLANSAAPVLSATLLMNPPASHYRGTRRPESWHRQVPRRSRHSWRARIKKALRPLIPGRYRPKVRLVLVAANALPKPASAVPSDDRSRKAA
jgi:hypothetical protein